MAEPNNYITATQKNFVSNDNEGRMVEKCIVEIQGTVLVKIRNDAFNGNDGENAYEHINKFLEIVGPIKINSGELSGMVRVGSMTYFQDHKQYTEIADGKLKDETLALKAKIEGSWGDATPRVIKFCRVLVEVNVREIALFTRMEIFERGPYANIKTEWAINPYLDINRAFGRDYKANNIGCPQENQGHKGDPIPEPSNCKVRRFEMMKYSFKDDEEYITIKESEYLKHSKDSLDAYRELLRLIDEGWVVTTPEDN
ncbi:hypothetical protein Tco_0542580 [Tanacetum coccineum]